MSKLEKIIKNCVGIDIGSEKKSLHVPEDIVRKLRVFTRIISDICKWNMLKKV